MNGLALATCCLAITGCLARPPAPAALAVEPLESPADADSAEPNLATTPDGKALLSWTARLGDEGHALRYATLGADGRWSEAREAARGSGWFVNWADFPSVLAHPDGSLWAHWLVRSGASKYAYEVRVARSDDGARWSESVVPHRDGTPSEHGFVSLLPWGAGVGAVWLDGRKMVAASPAGGGHEGHGGETALLFTTLGKDGAPGPEQELDPRVCDCCQTAAVRTPRGVLVVYRNRSHDEVRDIWAVRYEGGRWSAPTAVTRDGWKIDGCPVNGPALDARGESVALAWFAAPKDEPRAFVALSADSGASFGEPVRVDLGKPLGRVDVVMLEDGSALVSWLEQQPEGARVLARRVAPGGAPDPPVVIAASSAARSSGFPRLTGTPSGVIAAWTDAGSPSRVRTARLRVSLPRS